MQHAGVTPKPWFQKWQFAVVIDGFEAGWFQKADFPKVEFDESVFAPGGSMSDQKAAGRVKFNDITLEKGIPQDNPETSLVDWLKLATDLLGPGATGVGGHPSDYMKTIDIVEYNRLGTEVKRWRLHDAWPKTVEFGEGDGSSSDPNIENATICVNRVELT